MGSWCRSNTDLNHLRVKKREQRKGYFTWSGCIQCCPCEKKEFFCDGEVFFLDRGLLMGTPPAPCNSRQWQLSVFHWGRFGRFIRLWKVVLGRETSFLICVNLRLPRLPCGIRSPFLWGSSSKWYWGPSRLSGSNLFFVFQSTIVNHQSNASPIPNTTTPIPRPKSYFVGT